MGDPSPPNKGHSSPPIFDPCLLWPNDSMDKDETWHGGRPWPWPHCVRWGHSSPSPKGHSPPNFSAHVCCGQTAGLIKMPLSRDVDLSPGDIVLDEDPTRPPQKWHTPNFRSLSIVAKRSPISTIAEHLSAYPIGCVCPCVYNVDVLWLYA